MGFYGKVINYLTKAFSKIKIKNKEDNLSAVSYEDILILEPDEWVDISVTADKSLKIAHNTAQSASTSQPVKMVINKPDISDGSTITLTAPTFDNKGHQTGTKDLQIDINIDTLKNNIPNIDDLNSQIKDINKEIGNPAQDEENASGLYAYIDTETARAMAEETKITALIKAEELRAQEIEKQLDTKIDKTKDEILGGADLKETFDTLLDIQAWIEGDGVNATELAEAIAKETAERQEADNKFTEEDDKLSQAIVKNTEAIELLNGDIETKGSVVNSIAEAIEPLSKKDDDFEIRVKKNEEEIQVLKEQTPLVYETKKDATEKLQTAKDYTDAQITELDVNTVYSDSGYYISNISQVDGKIKPVWAPLPFDASQVKAVYDEATGIITLPFSIESK